MLLDSAVQLAEAGGSLRSRQRPLSLDEELLLDGTMTVQQAAEFTGYSDSSIDRLLDEGTLPWTQLRPNGRRLIPRQAIGRLMKENLVNPGRTR